MAKDFSKVNTQSVYERIEEATQEVKRPPRKTYTEEERRQYSESFQTQGRKGCTMPKMNIPLPESLMEYVRAMSRAQGLSMTRFVQQIIEQSMEQNAEEYKAILNLRKKFGRK